MKAKAWMEYEAHPNEPMYDPTTMYHGAWIMNIILRVRNRDILHI